MIINNADVVTKKKSKDVSDDKIKQTFQVNSTSHFWVNYIDVNHAFYVQFYLLEKIMVTLFLQHHQLDYLASMAL